MGAGPSRLLVQQEAWVLTIGVHSQVLAAGIVFANFLKAAWILTVVWVWAQRGVCPGVPGSVGDPGRCWGDRHLLWSFLLEDRALCGLHPPLSSPALSTQLGSGARRTGTGSLELKAGKTPGWTVFLRAPRVNYGTWVHGAGTNHGLSGTGERQRLPSSPSRIYGFRVWVWVQDDWTLPCFISPECSW